jgi:hypothetical protein
MNGKRWPQTLMGILVLVIGLMTVRHGMDEGELGFYGYGGARLGAAWSVEPVYIVLLGVGLVVLGIHVIREALR